MDSSFTRTAARGRLRPRMWWLWPAALLGGVLPAGVESQTTRSPTQTGVVRGVVVGSVGHPIAGAHVAIDTGEKPVITRDDGSFRFANVAAGSRQIVARRVGFSPETLAVIARAGNEVSVMVRIDPAPQGLASTIIVAERPQHPSRLQGFYDRRDRLTGHFFTSADIERLGARVVTDLLRTLPAVWIGRRGREANAITFRGASCPPMVFLDGAPAAAGYLDPDLVSTRSLAAVEVYTSSSRVPPEFVAAQGKSGCGAIALWTRQDPLRPRRSIVTAADLAELVESNRLHTAQSVQVPAAPAPDAPLRPMYPDSLFRARTSGRVIVEFVVSAAGDVEPSTIGIVQATHALFADAVREALLTARFTPATDGRGRVRQLVQIPFVFTAPTTPP